MRYIYNQNFKTLNKKIERDRICKDLSNPSVCKIYTVKIANKKQTTNLTQSPSKLKTAFFTESENS